MFWFVLGKGCHESRTKVSWDATTSKTKKRTITILNWASTCWIPLYTQRLLQAKIFWSYGSYCPSNNWQIRPSGLCCISRHEQQREVKLVSEFYRGDIYEVNLQCQLRQFAIIFECDGKKEEAVLSDVLLYMHEMTNRERLLLSEVVKVLKLVLVMPATNSTSERSFSTLQRIKTYIRSTMRQDRLNDLMILHVHKEKTDEINLQSVVRDFCFRENRQNIFWTIQINFAKYIMYQWIQG
jgi:hypothetical protein